MCPGRCKAGERVGGLQRKLHSLSYLSSKQCQSGLYCLFEELADFSFVNIMYDGPGWRGGARVVVRVWFKAHLH